MSDFAAEILSLMCSAYPDLTIDHQHGVMKPFFMNGLHPELHRLVMLSNPDTFEAAEKAAHAQEASDHFIYGKYAPWLVKKCKKKLKNLSYNVSNQSSNRFMPALVSSSEDKFT